MAIIITKDINLHKTEAIGTINSLTQEKILSLYPLPKQNTMLATWNNLAFLDSQLGANIFTNQNSPEGLAIQQSWNWIKAVIAASNVATTQINNALAYPVIFGVVSSYPTILAGI